MTLAEFLHPIRKSPKREQVVATLYYFKHQWSLPEVAPSEMRTQLIKARIPRARTANLSAVLGTLIPLVEPTGKGRWRITDTGEAHVRKQLELPTVTQEAQDDVGTLTQLSEDVSDAAVREYVDEAIKCLQVGARRAAVVFIWSGVIHEIRQTLWGKGKPQIEAALQKRYPKARFRRKDDFSTFKDITLIELTGDFSIYDQSQRKRLKEGLDLRNDCGHPVKFRPGAKKVSSFIEDMLQVVFGVTQ